MHTYAEISPNDRTDDQGLRVGIAIVYIWAYALDLFFLINLIYGTLKRIGPRYPFDCTTYAITVNAILSSLSANFEMDTDMQIVTKGLSRTPKVRTKIFGLF
eukprot:TRINITY_DN1012_c2_g1_i2.p1 TRINITY_DN1012_c2_g1~~TRINITY_DN1012_c2_g1_i2.p1  ORF type:complete len:102 (+),score=22.54 TRINITY_DN1012_c2_g1_i2:102-407(+)